MGRGGKDDGQLTDLTAVIKPPFPPPPLSSFRRRVPSTCESLTSRCSTLITTGGSSQTLILPESSDGDSWRRDAINRDGIGRGASRA